MRDDSDYVEIRVHVPEQNTSFHVPRSEYLNAVRDDEVDMLLDMYLSNIDPLEDYTWEAIA